MNNSYICIFFCLFLIFFYSYHILFIFHLFFALSVCIELNAKEYLCQDKAKKFLGQQQAVKALLTYFGKG